MDASECPLGAGKVFRGARIIELTFTDYLEISKGLPSHDDVMLGLAEPTGLEDFFTAAEKYLIKKRRQ